MANNELCKFAELSKVNSLKHFKDKSKKWLKFVTQVINIRLSAVYIYGKGFKLHNVFWKSMAWKQEDTLVVCLECTGLDSAQHWYTWCWKIWTNIVNLSSRFKYFTCFSFCLSHCCVACINGNTTSQAKASGRSPEDLHKVGDEMGVSCYVVFPFSFIWFYPLALKVKKSASGYDTPELQ